MKKLDEETVKAIAILNWCSNETGDAEGKRYSSWRNTISGHADEIPTELPDAILIVARQTESQFLIEDDFEGHHGGRFVRTIWQIAEDYPGHSAMVSWMARLLFISYPCISGYDIIMSWQSEPRSIFRNLCMTSCGSALRAPAHQSAL